jgi:hypothetical protein
MGSKKLILQEHEIGCECEECSQDSNRQDGQVKDWDPEDEECIVDVIRDVKLWTFKEFFSFLVAVIWKIFITISMRNFERASSFTFLKLSYGVYQVIELVNYGVVYNDSWDIV